MCRHTTKLAGEVHHHALTHHQSLLREEIALHVLGVDNEILQNVFALFQSTAKHVAGTRNSLPLRKEAAPVPLIFAHHGLNNRRGDAAHISAERQNVFQHSRIALVRHRG